ncbi:GNAT family N-acetyltransferase [Streptomyces sp. NPDC002698]|uniref:GNAT family N-acetyltransferase n=1 Tax=Streptomyces sp. NPDC002698 TaxID=3364660 RepID=UPI0036B1D757
MRFELRWIEPVMPVPYIPTLGPVHPDDPHLGLLEAVVANAVTGRSLPYDKDRRWSEAKTERVVDGIEHDRHRTLVPTVLGRGSGMAKVHVYGNGPDCLSAGADLARKVAAAHGAARARVVWFLGPGQPEERVRGGVRVRLRDFADGPGQAPDRQVRAYERLDHPERFATFAERMAADGFGFLHERMRAGTAAPVLTVLDADSVVGAIGPMETMSDAVGRARLLPQYFGVLPEYRGRGYGRALWRAAMCWGHRHGAAYQLLQTEVGGASDRLCAAEGLTSLGFVMHRTV